jgi:hypothetical protein
MSAETGLVCGFFVVCAFLHRLVVAVAKTRELPRGHGGEGSFAADKTHLGQLDEWTGTKSKHNSWFGQVACGPACHPLL